MMVAAAAKAGSAEAIRAAVARTGMRAEEWRAETQSSQASRDRHRRTQAALTAASGIFVILGVVLHAWIAGSLSEAFGDGSTDAA